MESARTPLGLATLEELQNDPTKRGIVEGVNGLGVKSAEAQHLKGPITSLALVAEQKHTLYVAYIKNNAVGMVKVGKKHLFYVNAKGKYTEMDPLCLLDFYVDESIQRQGIGLQLFQYMLQNEKVIPQHIAYDRPSPKLFPFLEKHFALKAYVPQPNRFVVFDAYFN